MQHEYRANEVEVSFLKQWCKDFGVVDLKQAINDNISIQWNTRIELGRVESCVMSSESVAEAFLRLTFKALIENILSRLGNGRNRFGEVAPREVKSNTITKNWIEFAHFHSNGRYSPHLKPCNSYFEPPNQPDTQLLPFAAPSPTPLSNLSMAELICWPVDLLRSSIFLEASER